MEFCSTNVLLLIASFPKILPLEDESIDKYNLTNILFSIHVCIALRLNICFNPFNLITDYSRVLEM